MIYQVMTLIWKEEQTITKIFRKYPGCYGVWPKNQLL